ncbi:MAG TPA: ferritin-like domain-containing protein, partial [Polyangiaceae bacterium]|nr:ferritin-like domain-containing protein [Polyangiaceae bacterium]
RRPPGLEAAHTEEDAASTGARFAEMAALEAASVVAFEALERELVHHRAPLELVGRVRAARSDETRHARVVAKLARKRGAEPRRLAIAPAPLRTLFEIALDNVREGCVGETFGAVLLARWARACREPELRRALAEIARDEAEHAALSFDLDAWLGTRLTDAERDAVEAARADKLEALARTIATGEAMGLPADAVTRPALLESTLADVQSLCAA